MKQQKEKFGLETKLLNILKKKGEIYKAELIKDIPNPSFKDSDKLIYPPLSFLNAIWAKIITDSEIKKFIRFTNAPPW